MIYHRKTRPAPWTMNKPQTKKKPRTRVKPATSKRAKELRQYRKRSKEWLEGKMCAVWPLLPATELHHKFGRRGNLLLWEPGWVAVSKLAHEWIHECPRNAGVLRFLGPVGTWNDFQKAKAYVEGK